VHVECATCIKESKDALEEVCAVGGFTLMQEYCPAVEDEEKKNAADPAPVSDAAEADDDTTESGDGDAGSNADEDTGADVDGVVEGGDSSLSGRAKFNSYDLDGSGNIETTELKVSCSFYAMPSYS
jgi:hypothetical protein